ncbi:MAG: glycosyltransferase family 4 protein [Gemmatimonadaceae bacterium]
MKLLMTADTVGGVWSYALELASALAPRGVEITIATMGAPLSDVQWREARALGKAMKGMMSSVDVVESTYRLEWMPEPWDDLEAAGDWLLGLAHALRPDLVHLNGYVHAALGWNAPTCVVAHSCVLSWWRAVKGELAPAEWSLYRQAVSAGLRAADVVVAPSRAMLNALELEYGPLPGARVIYNGRDAAQFPSSAKEPFVLSAGRVWDEAKNVAALDQAAPMLDWPVCIAGDAQPPGDPLADGFHYKVSARYLGRLDSTELAEWMARASIYALPARYEPFGLSVLEAALAGCALVLGDIPSLREIWGGAALFVPPGDSAKLRSTISELIGNDTLRGRVADACRLRALEFNTDSMADGYMVAYDDALHAAPSESRREACAS